MALTRTMPPFSVMVSIYVAIVNHKPEPASLLAFQHPSLIAFKL
jgi:copper(I)-binding protein